MLYSEEAVRANLRNRDGKRVFYLGKGDQLTSGARDWLNRERIPILSPEQAKKESYRLLSGGTVAEKPEHMTHLNSEVLVPKDHPRIVFRGKIDTLEANLLPCGPQVKEVLELVRKILRCDVLEQPLEAVTLYGLDQQELRKRSHFPQDYYENSVAISDIQRHLPCLFRAWDLSPAGGISHSWFEHSDLGNPQLA